jgi:cytochrome c-type biogenesis protein
MGELVGAVALGVGATLTPCILPLYPGFLAYLAGTASDGHRPPSAAIAGLGWGGVVTGMVVIGAIFAAIAEWERERIRAAR